MLSLFMALSGQSQAAPAPTTSQFQSVEKVIAAPSTSESGTATKPASSAAVSTASASVEGFIVGQSLDPGSALAPAAPQNTSPQVTQEAPPAAVTTPVAFQSPAPTANTAVLQKNLQNAEAALKTAQDRLKSMTDNYNADKAKIAQMADQVKSLKEQNTDRQNKISQALDEIRTLQAGIQELNSANDLLSAQLRNARTAFERNAIRDKIVENTNKIAASKRKINDKANQAEMEKKVLDLVKKDILALEKKILALEKTMANKLKYIYQQRETVERLTKARDAAQAALNNATQK